MTHGNDDIPAWQRKLIEKVEGHLDSSESRFDMRPRWTKEERDEYLTHVRKSGSPSPQLRPDGPIRVAGDQQAARAQAELLADMNADVDEREKGRIKTSFSRDDMGRIK